MSRPRPDVDFTFRLVPLVLRLLEARGVPVAARELLLETLPPGAATAPEVTAPLTEIASFLGGADDAIAAPSLGLSMATAVPRGTYAWIEFIARLSTTLEAGFQSVSRYYRLLNKGAEIQFFDRSGLAGLEVEVPGRREGWGRHLNEYTVALFHRITRELLPEWTPAHVWFAHPAPSWPAVEALANFFGLTPVFDAKTSGFDGPVALARRPLTSGDLTLQRLLEAQANEVLAKEQPLAQLTAKVRDAICQRMGKGEVGIEAIAPLLETSPRTLQRRLKEEGLSFQDVLDGARQEFAKRYLSQPTLGISEIAYLLGYSELRAFDRAFVRWTGKTPTAWRKAR